MAKKKKLVPLNIRIPLSLREHAESAASAEYDSLSDYVAALIERDQKRNASEPIEVLIDAITNYLIRSMKDCNAVESSEAFELLTKKLNTISSLFETGRALRELKIRRKNPKISEKALLKKLNAWALHDAGGHEVPGLFEVNEERKRKLQGGK